MLRIDRRSLLMTATLGLGAYAIPGFAQTDSVAALTRLHPFGRQRRAASDSMLLWTRFVPADGKPMHLIAEISATADFASDRRRRARRSPARGATVPTKITVSGLEPGTRYFYRFIGPDGTASPVGRTKTLPEGPQARSFKAAIFSCSNMPFGCFNAYGHAAARDDLDLSIHLGDYFYEYKTGGYPPLKDQVRADRAANELIHLADYRLRYASYRADPDLQALHARLPMIVQWDDHEFANDAGRAAPRTTSPTKATGRCARTPRCRRIANGCRSATSRGRPTRSATSPRCSAPRRAIWRAPSSPTSRRCSRRPIRRAALKAFRDGAWMDPAATMMGTQQEDWLFHALQALGEGGAEVADGRLRHDHGPDGDARRRDGLARSRRASERAKQLYPATASRPRKVGLPFNYDNWGGYPAARARFLRAAQGAAPNLVVISGDSHNGWAFDLGQDGKPAGVEFAGHSVTSTAMKARSRPIPRSSRPGWSRPTPSSNGATRRGAATWR